MANFSNYVEQWICNWIRGTSAPTAPTAVYVALFSSNPTDAGNGTEVTTTIRTAGRVAATFGAPSDGVISNTAVVDFGAAAGSASVTHFAIYDAASAGNLLMYNALSSGSGTVATGFTVSFAIGALTLTVA